MKIYLLLSVFFFPSFAFGQPAAPMVQPKEVVEGKSNSEDEKAAPLPADTSKTDKTKSAPKAKKKVKKTTNASEKTESLPNGNAAGGGLNKNNSASKAKKSYPEEVYEIVYNSQLRRCQKHFLGGGIGRGSTSECRERAAQMAESAKNDAANPKKR